MWLVSHWVYYSLCFKTLHVTSWVTATAVHFMLQVSIPYKIRPPLEYEHTEKDSAQWGKRRTKSRLCHFSSRSSTQVCHESPRQGGTSCSPGPLFLCAAALACTHTHFWTCVTRTFPCPNSTNFSDLCGFLFQSELSNVKGNSEEEIWKQVAEPP